MVFGGCTYAGHIPSGAGIISFHTDLIDDGEISSVVPGASDQLYQSAGIVSVKIGRIGTPERIHDRCRVGQQGEIKVGVDDGIHLAGGQRTGHGRRRIPVAAITCVDDGIL